jgi:TPR repeat protein
MYKNGDCIEQDYLKSGIWYSRAAKQGDSTAQYQLGQMYYQGLGVRKDPLEASKWYTFAAEKKHGDAQYQLGYLREKGEGLRQDVPQAIQFYKKSAMQKNPEAIYKLGIMRESGNGVRPDFKYALKFYKKAADLACLNAQLRLGHLYSDRDGSVFSVENASKYFKMAADQNHPEAKYRLAIMYLHGDGIKQDLTLAYNLFTESRKLHHKESNSLFQAPSSIIQNPDVDSEKFQDILTLACRNNFSSLEYTLGDFYEQQSIQYKLFRYTSNRKLRLAKTWYKAAASKNNPKAQYKLGQMYEAGQGVSQDWVRAVGYYEDARKNGNTDAIYTLAQLYLTGRGVSQSFQKAFDLYTEASNKGPIDAADLLFVSYQTVNGDKHVDYKRLLEEVANSGNTVIQHQLGILYLTDELLNYDGVQKGIEWLSRSSKGGYVLSPYHLGILYEEGIMIPQNYETAIAFYQLAEDEGNGNALYRLARLYHYGNGVKCDYRKAFDLYTNAAKYGNPLARAAIKITNNSIWSSLMNGARDIKCPVLDYDGCLQMWEYVANTGSPDLQYQLGKVYEQMGSKLDLNQAKEWYSKAASYSHGPSLFRLGRLFEFGNGVEKNYKKTIELYKKSALQHNNDALRALGNIYQQGNDVRSNISKSFGYYSSAAENGDSKAQFILGTLYERELVENGSFLDAFKWFSVAASQGNEEAHSHLNELDDNFNDSRNKRFDFKLLQLLSKLTKLEINNNGLGREFFGDVHYRLACMYYSGHGTPVDYEKAWDNFNTSYENYGESRAADFFNIGSRDLNSSMKAEYLKKLEMWESVASRLKKEKVYELGIIYYYGIYGDTDTSEPDNVCAIIEPNTFKSTKYFKMVIDIKLPGIQKILYVNKRNYF